MEAELEVKLKLDNGKQEEVITYVVDPKQVREGYKECVQ